jgi:hypothetical protein
VDAQSPFFSPSLLPGASPLSSRLGAKNGLRLSARSSAILYDWRMNKLYLESLLISFQVLKLPVTAVKYRYFTASLESGTVLILYV